MSLISALPWRWHWWAMDWHWWASCPPISKCLIYPLQTGWINPELSVILMQSRTILAPSPLGRDIMHVLWAPHPQQLLAQAAGGELGCHTHLCWETKHCSGTDVPTPESTWPRLGLGPLSTLPGEHGCQGVLPQCALDGVTHIWEAGKFTHPHQSAPASVNVALFSLFTSKAKEQLEVNPAF